MVNQQKKDGLSVENVEKLAEAMTTMTNMKSPKKKSPPWKIFNDKYRKITMGDVDSSEEE